MSTRALSYPRLKICKSKYPYVGWLIIIRISAIDAVLFGRYVNYADCLHRLAEQTWWHQLDLVLQANGAHALGPNAKK
jgi:hypothetical protein